MANKQNFTVCCCFNRSYKLKASEAPKDVINLFNQYSVNGIMTVDNFQDFLFHYEGEKDTTKERAQRIMDEVLKQQHHHVKIFHRKEEFNLEAFFRFLFSDSNPPLLPQVHHDMTEPLSHYFIYTGHNSYLTGNQISSKCSDVPIIQALQKGVRVIELDLWPNSSKDNIDVVHGWTLTTRVDLIKCLRSIKEYAFVASPYPVVITLEDHLTPDLQSKVAKMITDTYGKMLFIPGKEGSAEFRSPESLKYRILISTKPPKKHQEPKDMKEMEMGSHHQKDEPWGEEVSDLEKSHKPKKDREENKDSDDGGESALQLIAPPKYEALIAIHGAKSKGELHEVLRVVPDKTCRISWNELKFKKATETHKSHVVRFTQKNFLRIYPKGSRITSSNYNPLMGWIHGAQMVALNMQGYGRSLWMMHGMFRANGGSGYVKKPQFLLEDFGPYHHFSHFSDSLPVAKTLKVNLYMGEGWHLDFKHTHFDLFSPPDFYTKIGIAGVKSDSVLKQTETINDDWTPVWDQEFEFRLSVPELALLRIEVHESDPTGKDDFGGQTCLPVSELRAGIRAVPLYSRKGEKYKSVKLLMKFEFC
ncbi:hypothetical protein MKW98_005197 [Papaver atlanticum]|uniref:Phosphoinositide phospholipase C n=1 Tax=Papaver atlanticum TaxID=357466 RepID=A0AAD4RX41_9MAGN|nr:hypothetical protein MKW98_005197 [Papaver atlanticum]